MKVRLWTALCVAAVFALTGSSLRARDHDHDHGHGHDPGDRWEHHHRRGDDDGDYHPWYNYHDREEIHAWYVEHERHDDLPPGLARRDRLPPGLERQLVVRGELPPGLRRRMYRCPEGLDRELPPPPPHCAHFIIGGHIVLVNTRTYLVLDIFHFER